MNEALRVLLLQDYNTRLVVIGTAMLGGAAGLAGTFLMLRKRALLGDAVAHATLPGVVLTFILLALTGGNPRSLPWLLGGAAVFGTLGMLTVVLIRRWSRLKDDTALGIVLSVFFGFGVCLLSIASRLEGVNAAGLSSFIYGKTASMLMIDAVLIGGVALTIVAVVAVFYKELKLLCFDQDFAASQGLPVLALDVVLMGLIVAATVIGLQSVGLILVVALLVIPPAAARCWTHRLNRMLVLSAGIGAASGLFGSALSALAANLPAGAIIVLVAASLFLLSFFVGSERGVLWRLIRRWRLEREVGMQHLLRAVWELAEKEAGPGRIGEGAVGKERLMQVRSWSGKSLDRLVRRAVREDFLTDTPAGLRLTNRGERNAARHVRNHRLWELFLIRHADTAPSRVDRGADLIEHVLDEDLVAELEAELSANGSQVPVPASPHKVVPT
ncbi:iron chelate uptake ABC transporter family permease subunit [bacterium]|nr:iron chelate uptake ABC transporter family permease subunit [bacterium]